MTNKEYKIAVFAGDGVGPEIMNEAIKVLKVVTDKKNISISLKDGLIGGSAYDVFGTPFPDQSLNLALESDSVLLGAVGGPKWEGLDYSLRPERALLGLREKLGLYANLRPVVVFDELVDASPLKKNTMIYREDEIRRIALRAFELARTRKKSLLSVDKANVLESTELWRSVVTETGRDYADIELKHMYVDNCAMQLIRNPSQFDVIVTTNLFGDILSDEAAMLTGSIGMLPSASLGETKALYEPIHGSAPDIAGKNIANPLATILSVAMMLRHSLSLPQEASLIEKAVAGVLKEGWRTQDIYSAGSRLAGTEEMGNAVVRKLVSSDF
ncbi:MAG: 3-isopropylmalate dehydrogenase [Deltaproteobacteria bacterium HGW-Deltaproteobacteria-5]|nr:MAG: 3-isopropylmalate dehydrogenase [Deltaproteobacteria bacterium HGW-Deltaproteobacteria-5]